jgi:hypothetical protein
MPHDDQDSFGSRRVLISVVLLSAASVGTALVALEVRSRNIGASSTVRSCDVIPDRPWWRWAACGDTQASLRNDTYRPSLGTTSSVTSAPDAPPLPENFPVDWSDLARPFDGQTSRSTTSRVSAPSPADRNERSTVVANVSEKVSRIEAPAGAHSERMTANTARDVQPATGQAADGILAPTLPDVSGLVILAETQARLSSLSAPPTLPSVPDAAVTLAARCNSGGCDPVSNAVTAAAPGPLLPLALPPEVPVPAIPAPTVAVPLPPTVPAATIPPAPPFEPASARAVPPARPPSAVVATPSKSQRQKRSARTHGAAARSVRSQVKGELRSAVGNVPRNRVAPSRKRGPPKRAQPNGRHALKLVARRVLLNGPHAQPRLGKPDRRIRSVLSGCRTPDKAPLPMELAATDAASGLPKARGAALQGRLGAAIEAASVGALADAGRMTTASLAAVTAATTMPPAPVVAVAAVAVGMMVGPAVPGGTAAATETAGAATVTVEAPGTGVAAAPGMVVDTEEAAEAETEEAAEAETEAAMAVGTEAAMVAAMAVGTVVGMAGDGTDVP